ncbi:MAG: polyphosphate kinase 2 family protein [Pirellulaceae bacterium]|nr:polyphosphate kinase 2 family protein [Pirellulaceae bacterium]
MPSNHRFQADDFLVVPNKKLDLAKRSTKAGKELDEKQLADEALAADVSDLQLQQQLLFANRTHGLLIIIQGMDTSGKDGVIRHVMGAINPQGCRVFSFGPPTAIEQRHHFLWRPGPCLPEKGMISLFNRSYYEETLVVRVHPQFLEPQRIPGLHISKPKALNKLWTRRFKEIRTFERSLVNNGILVLKFFLHISHSEQRERLLARLREPDKHWKFNAGDLAERKLWSEYQRAYQQCMQETSTRLAPWFVIPADNKWYARGVIADLVAARLERLKMKFPEVSEPELARFPGYIQQLEQE